MKKIVIFKDKGKDDIFDTEDKVINVMTPSTFSPKKLGLGDKVAFLYKGFPMYLDRTVIHARREDKKMVDELLSETFAKESAEKPNLFSRLNKLRENFRGK